RADTGRLGDSVSDLVQPTTDGIVLADRPGLADQSQKRGLKSVLRVVRVAADATANIEDHLAVPPNQQLERRLIAVGREALQQLGVRHFAQPASAHRAAEMVNNALELLGRHECSSPGVDRLLRGSQRMGTGSESSRCLSPFFESLYASNLQFSFQF